MHFLSEYGLFLAKILTALILIFLFVLGIILIIAASKSNRKEKNGRLTIQSLNEKYLNYQKCVNEATHVKEKKNKIKKKKSVTEKKRLFVLHFSGDIKASTVPSLREEVTAILVSRKEGDEVLLCIESPGGVVPGYGLAAAQLERFKAAKIKLTIAIDKVAASGGYLMACLADHLISAPLAIVGSIGVIAQLPNFNRWLSKNEIDFEQIQAGQYKRTLTLFGKNTSEARQKMQEEVNEAHDLFKKHIMAYRPVVNIEQVATGEYWYGSRALELNLVDEIKTSDDFLLAVREQFDIYLLKYEVKKNLLQQITTQAQLFSQSARIASRFISFASGNLMLGMKGENRNSPPCDPPLREEEFLFMGTHDES